MDATTYYEVLLGLPLGGIVLDIVTGVIGGAANNELNSSILKKGLWSKLAEVCAIILGLYAQAGISFFGDLLGIKVDIPIHVAVCAYVLLYELVSIMENIGKINPDLARWLYEFVGISANKMNLSFDTFFEDEEEDENGTDSTVR